MSAARLRIIIATHSTQVVGPPDALLQFALRSGYDVDYIDHPLDYDPLRHSSYTCWRGGRKVKSKQFANWGSFAPLNYVKDLLLTMWIMWRYVPDNAVAFIGFDSLCCLGGLWSTWPARYQQLIAYNADYSTSRFSAAWLNAIYLWIDRYTMKRAQKIWCVSSRIAEVRRQTRSEQDVLVVPNGVALQQLNRSAKADDGLVYIGNLTPEKGLDKVLEQLVDVPQSKLTIYGDGGVRSQLEDLVKQLNITERVHFAGRVDNKTILEKLSGYTAGLALYQPHETYVYYSDPLKVKEYLAAGLPVIMTDLPEIAESVKTAQAGVVIQKINQLAEAVRQVQAHRHTMSQAARQLAKRYDWDMLFTQAFIASQLPLKGNA